MDEATMKQRTKKFGLRIIKLVEALPKTQTAYVIGKQILRSGTSIGANYYAACRGRSKADFASKIGIALEEADETLYWLEMIAEAGLMPMNRLEDLITEANELVSILVASTKTLRVNSGKD